MKTLIGYYVVENDIEIANTNEFKTETLKAGKYPIYHNGSFKQTSIGGGVNYYTGDGDIWIIYRNPRARSKYSFKTSNGKVQTCDDY